jgi:hypothetical protein
LAGTSSGFVLFAVKTPDNLYTSAVATSAGRLLQIAIALSTEISMPLVSGIVTGIVSGTFSVVPGFGMYGLSLQPTITIATVAINIKMLFFIYLIVLDTGLCVKYQNRLQNYKKYFTRANIYKKK